MEITTQILAKKDQETGKALVDVIVDRAGQKGTGKWTVGHAVEMGCPLSTISAAVEARILSSMKEERVAASAQLPAPATTAYAGDRKALIEAVRDALYASKIVSYAQGFVQLGAAAKQYGWELHFGDIATIWRGGCIIRAHFLNRIKQAYELNPSLKNLLLDPYFTQIIAKTQENWRLAISVAVTNGIAVPAFASSLAYYDSYRSARLPANLLQAQRDFFGAHTYERIDKPVGQFFHTEWMQ
jgi:6-phosphogluconate dehydrogenase